MPFTILVTFLSLAVGAVTTNTECNPHDGTCSNNDHTGLLQSRMHVSQSLEAEEEQEQDQEQHVFSYGPYPGSILDAKRVSKTGVVTERSLMDYFKTWARGKIVSHHARKLEHDIRTDSSDSLLQTDSRALTAEEASLAYITSALAECPDQVKNPSSFGILHTEARDRFGLRHVLLKTQQGELQYMATQVEDDGQVRAVVADPPLCQKLILVQHSNGTVAPDGGIVPDGPPLPPMNGTLPGSSLVPGGRKGGGAELLKQSDPLVKDCLKLFHRTLFDNCNKTANVSVRFATTMIIDGLEVHMDVDVCTSLGCHPHHPECLFEHSLNHTDASLLEAPPTAEEKAGLQATLRLMVPLCDVDHTDGTNTTDGNLSMDHGLNFVQGRAMGELSRYKGYEHVNDDLPRWSALETTDEASATNIDFRTKYPDCYKGQDGSEVVRNQGTCGSCWAFAGASTTMNALCISGHGASGSSFFNSATDRKEVSVQKVLSCAPSGEQSQDGCNGGNMGAFDSGAYSWGLTAEKNNEYKCGGGNPHKHFQQGAAGCKAFPWGGACTGSAQKDWWWGGAASVSGATAMESYIAQGYPLYVTCDVYSNFMNHGDGIYSDTTGKKEGGHAMTALGYGKEGGVKYWLIQNSWGPSGWGVEGFGKMIRGKNIAGLEEEAYVVRAWADGTDAPPCWDSNDGTGLSATGNKPYIPCSEAAGGSYGNLCTKYATAKRRCPKTCGQCSGYNGADKAPPPSPAPSPASPTTAAPAPPANDAGCSDDVPSGIKLNGQVTPCSSLGNYCNHAVVKKNCRMTCGQCAAPTTAAPPAPPTTTPPANDAGCSDKVPSNIKLNGQLTPCSSLGKYCNHAVVKKNCPKTCDQCHNACQDDDNFICAWDYECSEWEGYQCPTTGTGAAERLKKCPRACGVC